jgi:twitching motility protein PilT
MTIEMLLKMSTEKNASDLHLSDGLVPKIRIDGDLIPVDSPQGFSQKPLMESLTSILTKSQLAQFQENLELDFSLTLNNIGRFRGNVFKQDRGVSAAFRVIPPRVFTLEELLLPDVLKRIAHLPHGLVLVTGPTGSGKTTTLASIIHYINQARQEHIVTIEDPIEYVHAPHQCLINQREVSRDTKSFNSALRSVLREDPDIILVGELRDLESVRLALTAAETGHLVFASVHTSSAAKTINRIIDIFPVGGERNLIQAMLSESLQAVISQTLVKKNEGGRIAALEVMLCTSAVRNLIREDKISQIYSCIQTGAALGMQTLDQHLRKLLDSDLISKETARAVANSKELFN